MADVVALGEVLVDFTPADISGNGNIRFERNPGGAPANVLAVLSKLGVSTSFIGKVGQDQFGTYLHETLNQCHIDTEGLVFAEDVRTTLAFVHLDDDGDRSFSFYRNPGADMMLEPSEINVEQLKDIKVFHFGSLSMTHEPSASATLFACRYAKEHGALVSFDPNYRASLWKDEASAVKAMFQGLDLADIVKLSLEELELLTGSADLDKGTSFLAEQFNIQVLLVTLGEQGCYLRIGKESVRVPGFEVTTIDTTGAGDAFLGGFLYKLLQYNLPLPQLAQADYTEAVRFANAVGALTTTKKGAIPALPAIDEIEKLVLGLPVV